MAGRDRMTIEEVVRRVLRDEHADVTRESVGAVARELMEIEVSGGLALVNSVAELRVGKGSLKLR